MNFTRITPRRLEVTVTSDLSYDKHDLKLFLKQFFQLLWTCMKSLCICSSCCSVPEVFYIILYVYYIQFSNQ